MSGSTDNKSSQESRSGSGVPAEAVGGGTSPTSQDMISLDEVDMVSPQTGFEPAAGRTNGGGKGDTLMQAAEAFEQQLQHMSAWKHQLASQMELLRRDGIKMLERQKNMALERGKLRQEREALEKEKAEGGRQRGEIEEARRKLDERAASLEKTTEALMALQSQKEKWMQDVSAAREATAKLNAERGALATEMAAIEAQAAEYRKLAGERDALLGQIHEAKSTLEELGLAQKEMLAERQSMELRAGELQRQAEEFAERERKILGQETILREAAEQLEGQRKALVEGQLRLTQEQDQVKAQIREQALWLEDARHHIESEQVASKQQVAAAEERLRELSEAQKKFEIDKQELANRAISLEGQELQLAKREADVAETVSRLIEQEATLKGAQEELAAHQAKLAAAESTLAEHRAKIEAELAQRIAAAEAAEGSLKAREAEFQSAKQEAQKKLDVREASIAEELEHVAKQSKRLNEKRAEIDAETARLEATIATKVKAATEQIRAELTQGADAANAAVAEYKARCAALEDEIRGIGERGKGKDEELASARAELAAAQKRIGELQEELKDFATTRERVTQLEATAQGLEKDRLAALEAATELNRQIEGHRAREAATAESEAAARGELSAAVAGGEKLRAALAEESAAKATLSQQITGLKLEITRWREQYEAAQAMNNVATGDAEETESARAAVAAAQRRLAEVEAELSAAEASAEKLRQEIAAAKAREKTAGDTAAKALNELQSLRQTAQEAQETLRNSLVLEYQEKLAAAKAEFEKAPPSASAEQATTAEELQTLRESVRMLEAQRDELGADLLAAQEAVGKARSEAAVSKAAVEAELTHLRVRCEQLENENQKLARAKPKGPASPNQSDERQTQQRARLLRQAREVRAFRKQQLEVKGSLESSREEMAQQREQLQQRKENLEQVKRLLEKQEMVMARKLADHSAIKTVAAVIISVVMILGGTFMAVYKFVSPVYGSEALVQVEWPAASGQWSEAQRVAWLQKQSEAVRSEAVAFEAWKKLRSDNEKYGVHESREEWLSSFPRQLAVKADGATRTVSIQYESSSPEGAAQVCNALASAYVASVVGAPGPATASAPAKAGATELAKAFAKPSPKKDGRLMTALTATAGLLFVALIAVMLGRYYVRRQLREIDRMADEAELEDIKGDLPIDAGVA